MCVQNGMEGNELKVLADIDHTGRLVIGGTLWKPQCYTDLLRSHTEICIEEEGY